jgi:N6-L-threonylcarbamoyladenine synthase
LHQLDSAPDETVISQISCAFQTAAVDVLTQKALRAAKVESLNRIVVAGGVACNSGLRKKFTKLTASSDIKVFFPSPILCADNAAMLAVAGDYYLSKGMSSELDLNAVSNWPLEQVRGV